MFKLQEETRTSSHKIIKVTLLFRSLSQDGLVIEDEMSLDAGIVSASFDASLEMVRELLF